MYSIRLDVSAIPIKVQYDYWRSGLGPGLQRCFVAREAVSLHVYEKGIK